MQSRIRPWRWRYVLLRCFTGYGLWRLLFWCFCVFKFCFLTSLPQGMGFEAHQPISDREKDGWDNIREPPWRLTSDFCQIGMRQTLCGLTLLNNPSVVPHSHIAQVWALKSSNLHQIPAGQMTEHICKASQTSKSSKIYVDDPSIITSWNLNIAWLYLWHYDQPGIISSVEVTILHYLWQINTYFRSLTRRGARRG